MGRLDTMHLCDAGKEAVATAEWWHPVFGELVLCGHHARRFERALTERGFESMWIATMTELTPARADAQHDADCG